MSFTPLSRKALLILSLSCRGLKLVGVSCVRTIQYAQILSLFCTSMLAFLPTVYYSFAALFPAAAVLAQVFCVGQFRSCQLAAYLFKRAQFAFQTLRRCLTASCKAVAREDTQLAIIEEACVFTLPFSVQSLKTSSRLRSLVCSIAKLAMLLACTTRSLASLIAQLTKVAFILCRVLVQKASALSRFLRQASSNATAFLFVSCRIGWFALILSVFLFIRVIRLSSISKSTLELVLQIESKAAILAESCICLLLVIQLFSSRGVAIFARAVVRLAYSLFFYSFPCLSLLAY